MALDPSVFENSPLQAYQRGRMRETDRKQRKATLLGDQLRNISVAQQLKELVATEKTRKRQGEVSLQLDEMELKGARREERRSAATEDLITKAVIQALEFKTSPEAQQLQQLQQETAVLEEQNRLGTLPVEGQTALIKGRAIQNQAVFHENFNQLNQAIDDDMAWRSFYSGFANKHPTVAQQYFPKGLATSPEEREAARTAWMMDIETSRKILQLTQDAKTKAAGSGIDLKGTHGKNLLDKLAVIQIDPRYPDAKSRMTAAIQAFDDFNRVQEGEVAAEGYAQAAKQDKIVESTFASNMAGLLQGKIAMEQTDDTSVFRLVGEGDNTRLVVNELFMKKVKETPGRQVQRQLLDNVLMTMKEEYRARLFSKVGEYGGSSNAAFHDMLRYWEIDHTDYENPIKRREVPTDHYYAAIAKLQALIYNLENMSNDTTIPDEGLTLDRTMPTGP